MNLARTFKRISASKYGCSYFGKLEEQGIYARVGYGDLIAVKACQDESVTSLTSEIRGDRSSDAFRAKTWIYSFVATNCEELQFLWQPAETHIAQLELSMVIYALSESPDLLRHRHGLWFLDAVAAVMTLVRGFLWPSSHCVPRATGSTSRARATGPTTSVD